MTRVIDVFSMGCSKNLVDSEKLMYLLQGKDCKVYHNPNSLHKDVAVVNTCGFISDAQEESINMILSLVESKMKGDLRKVYVMGCLSQRFLKELKKEIFGVDGFYGKFDWENIVVDLLEEPIGCVTNQRVLTTPKHYAYLKISEGCNRGCAYCAIPIITGKHKSRSMEDILDEVKYLRGLGVKEFQVVAQELTYYGLDLYGKRKLAELVERISDVSGVEWIRLHYGYPNSFPMDLLPVMRERENVCRYMDIALQHSSNSVLNRMLRNTTREYQEDLILRLREEVPGIALRTTFMVGYPGETDEEFADLMDFTTKMRFERMGAFIYSEEAATPAAKRYKDDVPFEVKQQRLDELMELQQEISLDYSQSMLGTTQKVIIDSREGDYYIGRTEFDSPEVDGEVLIPANSRRLIRGNFYNVKIQDASEFDLIGEVVK